MATLQHVGVRVSDLATATEFYVAAFDATELTRPFLREGPQADVTLAYPGVRYRVCHLGLGADSLELFEIEEPLLPFRPYPDLAAGLLHLAIQVENIPFRVARVEAAGGRRLWPEPRRFGTGHVIYVADPDDNPIELLDGNRRQTIDAILTHFPDARP